MMTIREIDITVEFILRWLEKNDPEQYAYWMGVIAESETAANDCAEVRAVEFVS